jgi:steroid delta-isomerase-like uncharacterized protein
MYAEVMTTTSGEQTVRRIYDECLNGGRQDVLPELVADDYVGPQGDRGPVGFGQTIAALRAGFPDIRFTVEDMVASGDRVAVRWSWRGTHTGPFRGLTPSGKAVTDTGMAFYRLKDGKVVRAWVETDRLGVLQQVGAIPSDVGAPRAR